MPFTPFFGVSVIVHLGFIISHKFFKLSNKGTQGNSLIAGWSQLNSLVVLGVFLVVTSTAFFLVKESLAERHSSVYLAERAAGYFYPSTKAGAPYLIGSAVAYVPPSGQRPALVFGQVLKTETPATCAQPPVGNYDAYNYLISYSYPDFLGSVQKATSGFNYTAFQNATYNIVTPRGTPAPDREGLAFGACGQTAVKDLIN